MLDSRKQCDNICRSYAGSATTGQEGLFHQSEIPTVGLEVGCGGLTSLGNIVLNLGRTPAVSNMNLIVWPCIAIMIIWSCICIMVVWSCIYVIVVLSCFYVIILLLRFIVGRHLQ